MKKFITYYKWFLLTLIGMLSSCVSDDSVIVQQGTRSVVPAISIVSFLNDVSSKGSAVQESDLCFRFVYPIQLVYNTSSSIEVNDFSGLIDVVTGQLTNFNVNGIAFPLEVILNENETPITVEDEDTFYGILDGCGISTFRDNFGSFSGQCFKFKYPIGLLDNETSEKLIASDEELNSFIQSQGDTYQPNFKFPLEVMVAANVEPISISTYFEFYDIINNCQACPDNVSFTSQISVAPATYRFTSNIQNANIQFSWTINGREVGSARNNTFEYDFYADSDGNLPTGAGTYTICVKVITEECSNGMEFCEEITVPSLCPDLRFVAEAVPNTFSYNFTANFPGIGQTKYVWKVDGAIIEDSDGGVNGDNFFSFRFVPGTHQVCIESISPACPQGAEFCEQVIVCPELSFTTNQQGATNTYMFNADFLGRSDIMYEWAIDGVTIETDGGAGADNSLTFNFAPGASYEVCVVANVVGCTAPTSQRFCNTITIP